MIKIIISTIVIFIIFFIILLLSLLLLNIKYEKFSNEFVSKTYTILKDENNNIINPYIWYKFDDNFKDELNRNNLINNNASFNTVDFAKGTASLNLNKNKTVDFSIDIPFYNIQTSSGITYSFWFNAYSDTTAYSSLWAFANTNGYLIAHYWRRSHTTNGIEFGLWGGDWTVGILNDQNYFNGNWYHVIWSISTNGIWTVYINGINKNINITKSFTNISYTKTIKRFGTSNGNNYFNGNIDDFRIYDRVLNDEQVYKLANGYNRVGEIIDTSTNCAMNNASSGLIRQIPPANMNITIVSPIKKLNDAIYEQTFGDETTSYTITFSKFHSDDYSPIKLFKKNNTDDIIAYLIDNYDDNGDYRGIFLNNPNLGLSNFSEKGDFLHFKFPTKITLKRYGFVADKSWVSRAPGTWVIYGLNRTKNETRQLVKNTQRLNNNNYCVGNLYTFVQNINENTFECDEIIFIFTGLASSTSQNNPGRVLSFTEILLYSS